MRFNVSAVFVVVMMAGCGVAEGTLSDPGADTKASGAGLSWEQFRATKVFIEPQTGIAIADGDTPFFSEKQLREFYELNVQQGQLIVNRIGNADDVWDTQTKLNMTYCVANSFGTHQAEVVQAMSDATGSWMSVANLHWVYVSAENGNCTASNSAVLFNVRPVNVNGQYIARSFFPSTSRSGREVLVDNTAFDGTTVLAGVLRHELGHTIGFRHEHTRPEAGACFEDNNWRALTPYDSASVMHYPQCNGTNDWSLPLTSLDKQGAAALYGAPGTGGGSTGGGGGGGGSTGGGAGSTGTPVGPNVETFSGSVAASATKNPGPFAVKAGTQLHLVMSGTGDADLYVRFGAAPTASKYDCRPYLDGSNEECLLTVPATAAMAYVSVVGYKASNFQLRVEYTKLGQSAQPPPGHAQQKTASGSVAQNQLAILTPFTVVAGTTFTVTMTGTGDPDLYVRFGAAPSLTAFDCRPYLDGASEQCSVTVPAGQTQAFVAAHGYAVATYNLSITYTGP